ncbi:protein WHAT'S THIS FACTOR 9, mitochondrial [Magnolia sinica]|uniref:protein WHAT'S THIS FACTOR 9, mitochondrial n=1 Tax=Magnolia sinica TaxID=86752 RepID=UPI002659BB54|nr:protein WHAT'S THIS FACTOR 9, mitochondrial [Magnolia sinica]XP_058092741.1 protein WHAT'S THIS FACTOR 9, mitochondrial [Magnolia sinica]
MLLFRQHLALFPHAPFLQTRSLVNVKLKWVKDRILDSVIVGERDLKAACELKDKLANAPNASLPIYKLNRRRRQLGLSHIRVSAFIRQYPNLFHEFPDAHSAPVFRLSQEALKLHQEELQTLQENEPNLVQRLCKLLMLTADRTLPLHTIDQLKWDMGLPFNYQETLIPHYPQFFKLICLPDDRPGLKLLTWDPHFAVSELQKNNGGGNGEILAFPVKFTRGFGLKRKCMAWLEEWQQLPYTSPYVGPSGLDPRTDVSEKRIVGVFHELLHLTIGRRTERANVSNLRKPLQLPQKFTKVFGRHPGIFYISQKCNTQTVVLREAYDGRELVQKHPLVGIRERFKSMMRTGKLDRSRGVYKKVPNDDKDGEDHRLSHISDDDDFESDGLTKYECSSDCSLLSDDDIDDDVEAPC